MSHSDAFTRAMERDPVMRSTVVMVAVLDSAPEWDRFVARIARGMTQIPLMNARMVPGRTRFTPPRWVPVDDADLGWHLTHLRLPAPGSWEQAMAVAARSATTVLDPSRPLWEITLVEGLADERAACIMTFHHSITDGIGGVTLAMNLFDVEPDPVQHPLGPPSFGLPDPTAGTAPFRRRLAARARSLREHPLTSVAGTARTLASTAKLVAPFRTTLSPVMTGRTLARTFDTVEVPLDGLRRAAKAGDAKLNDAFLTGLTGGLRRYHDHHGAPVDALRVSLPISLRNASDQLGGNKITLVRFRVDLTEADPVTRMQRIGAEVAALRDEPALPHTQRIAAGLNLLPASVVGGMLKHIDFLASNVPGFPIPVFLAGPRVTAFYPFGPTAGSSMNVTLMTYDQTCCLGVSCDSAAVPDAGVLLECLAEGFREVLAVGGEHDPVTTRSGF